jgi:hypothetical protein
MMRSYENDRKTYLAVRNMKTLITKEDKKQSLERKEDSNTQKNVPVEK